MAVQRWRIEDPSDPDPTTRGYTFALNPNKMSTLFPERAVTYEGTTAVDGQPIMWEAATPPTKWSFGGPILNAAHHEALRHWTYDRQGRLWLWDHYGRRILLTLTKFDAEPKRALNRPWRHDYTITAWVYSVGAPTIGLDQ